MQPRAPLSLDECITEARQDGGYSVLGARAMCVHDAPRNRIWYHAVLSNRGEGAYPACAAQGFDSSGRIVYDGPLSFAFGGELAGLFAEGHRSIAFDWYLPSPIHGSVTRFMSSCEVNSNPPI